MKINIPTALRTAQTVITANSPVLLVGTAIAGVVATGVLAARGGYKARGIIEDYEATEERDTTVQEKFKLTWLCYAPAALTGASSIASVAGVHTIHTKRHAALAGLYAVTQTKLDDYKDEVEKVLTPKKSQDLNNAVAQKQVDRDGFVNNEVIITDGGTELCYDEWSGRFFLGSMNKIESAVIMMNKKLQEDGEQTLNELYDDLGLKGIAMGTDFGWPGGTVLEPRFGAVTTSDGRSAISFWFHENPQPGCGVRK